LALSGLLMGLLQQRATAHDKRLSGSAADMSRKMSSLGKRGNCGKVAVAFPSPLA
jgi:hypothetical protein